jgi:hypothetical protein
VKSTNYETPYNAYLSSLPGPNILLSTMFSNTHYLGCFLRVSDEVSYIYKVTGKISILSSAAFHILWPLTCYGLTSVFVGCPQRFDLFG